MKTLNQADEKRVAPATTPEPASASRAIATKQTLAGVRLHKHDDYQRAYAASRKRQSSLMSWFLAPQQPYRGVWPTGPRVGLTVGKVIGKSHERSRIKRRMREVLRTHRELLPAGCDLILHPRRTVLHVEFEKLQSEVVRILEQAGREAARMTKPDKPAATC